MKKCPPGVICIENFTSLILFAIVFIIGYFIYVSMKNSNSQHRNSQPQNNNNRQNNGTTEIVLQPSYPYNNLNIMSLGYYKENKSIRNMVKMYLGDTQIKELKMKPKNETLTAILNYSKSLMVKKVLGEKVIIHQN